jgi:hypothetical protein
MSTCVGSSSKTARGAAEEPHFPSRRCERFWRGQPVVTPEGISSILNLRTERNGRLLWLVYRTPSPFTPNVVRALEPLLRRWSDAKLELQVRAVRVNLASTSGYCFQMKTCLHESALAIP